MSLKGKLSSEDGEKGPGSKRKREPFSKWKSRLKKMSELNGIISRRSLNGSFLWRLRMQGGWRWLRAALGVVLRLEGNTVMLVGVLTTVGLISHESRCRIYTILKRKLLGFIQVHTRCCTGTGPARSDSWKSIAGPESPTPFRS